MSVYLVDQIEITDPESYKDYVAGVPAIVARHGGEYLVRGGDMEVLEGEQALPRNVIIRFPSRRAALDWYNSDEYRPLRDIRQGASRANLVLVDGI